MCISMIKVMLFGETNKAKTNKQTKCIVAQTQRELIYP